MLALQVLSTRGVRALSKKGKDAARALRKVCDVFVRSKRIHSWRIIAYIQHAATPDVVVSSNRLK
jgi:hypothetical protein